MRAPSSSTDPGADQALEYVANHPGVWLATSDEIAEHYTRTTATKAG
ncbi:hypothetical protein [Embleya scabrispora]|nr:hypothetical protein [Embleya scabrispora]